MTNSSTSLGSASSYMAFVILVFWLFNSIAWGVMKATLRSQVQTLCEQLAELYFMATQPIGQLS